MAQSVFWGISLRRVCFFVFFFERSFVKILLGAVLKFFLFWFCFGCIFPSFFFGVCFVMLFLRSFFFWCWHFFVGIWWFLGGLLRVFWGFLFFLFSDVFLSVFCWFLGGLAGLAGCTAPRWQGSSAALPSR